jgi:hypothetical protein
MSEDDLLTRALEIAVALGAPGREIDAPLIARLTQFLYGGLRDHAVAGLPIELGSARCFGEVLLRELGGRDG